MNSHRYPLILSVFRVTSPSDRGYLRLNNQEDNAQISLTDRHQRSDDVRRGFAVPHRFAHRDRFGDKPEGVKAIGDGLLGADHRQIHRPWAMATAGEGDAQRPGVNPQLC